MELERLDLPNFGIAEHGLRALAEGGLMPRLRELLLPHNGIGTKEIAALTEGEPFPAPTTLDLRGNRIGSSGAAALASTPWVARQVRHLDLGYNWDLKSRGAGAIAASLRPSTLRLEGCQIGLKGVAALARSPNMDGLRVLNIYGNGLDDRAARLILESPHLESLVSLDMRYNDVGRKMQAALRRRFGPGVCHFTDTTA